MALFETLYAEVRSSRRGDAMIYLLLFFCLTQLALAARYVVYGAFEPWTYASTYLLIVAALFVYMRSKHVQQQEVHYVPPPVDGWSFLVKQHTFTNEKPLFFADERRGTIQRIFQKRWHYVVADTFGESFFLCLRVVIDDDVWCIQPVKKWALHDQHWHITCNDVPIAEAKTMINWQNTKKLTEMIVLQTAQHTYQSTASTLRETITLTKDDAQIGHVRRHHLLSSIHVFELPAHEREALLCALLHLYTFKQR